MTARLSMLVGCLILALSAGMAVAGEKTDTGSAVDRSPTPAGAQADQTPENARMAFNPGSVARAVITTGVQDREPVDHVDVVNSGIHRIYFFTELRDMTGQHVVHRWMHNGHVVAKIGFDVAGPRWRVWSSKRLLPSWTGTWTVQVVNVAGDVVASKRFTYARTPNSSGRR